MANRPGLADAELVGAIRERIGEGAWHVVAADGGARLAVALGMNPDVVVGDMDSLGEPLRRVLEQDGCRFILYSEEKDFTDTHLAMDWAYLNGFRELCVVLHRSGRLDHVLGTIWAACRYVEMGAAVRFVDAGFEAALLRGPSAAEIRGGPGLIVSLLPLSTGAVGITLSGLKYGLRREALRLGESRGISNIMVDPVARVELEEGILLVTVEERPE